MQVGCMLRRYRHAARLLSPCLLAPVQASPLPVAGSGFREVRTGDVHAEGTRRGRGRRVLLGLLQRGHRRVRQAGPQPTRAPKWGYFFFFFQYKTFNAQIFTELFLIVDFLGPSRKTFIFIESRIGQFGKSTSECP